jgi:hypothetical protein
MASAGTIIGMVNVSGYQLKRYILSQRVVRQRNIGFRARVEHGYLLIRSRGTLLNLVRPLIDYLFMNSVGWLVTASVV